MAWPDFFLAEEGVAEEGVGGACLDFFFAEGVGWVDFWGNGVAWVGFFNDGVALATHGKERHT